LLALGISLIFGGLRVGDAVGGADQFGRVTQLARLGEQGTILVQDLQNERDKTAAVVGGASAATLKQPYSATNTAAAQFMADATALGGGFPVNIRSGVAAVLTDAENRGSVRSLAKANGNPTTVLTDYTDSIQDIISLTGLIAQGDSRRRRRPRSGPLSRPPSPRRRPTAPRISRTSWSATAIRSRTSLTWASARLRHRPRGTR
jgi:hypothetical protein